MRSTASATSSAARFPLQARPVRGRRYDCGQGSQPWRSSRTASRSPRRDRRDRARRHGFALPWSVQTWMPKTLATTTASPRRPICGRPRSYPACAAPTCATNQFGGGGAACCATATSGSRGACATRDSIDVDRRALSATCAAAGASAGDVAPRSDPPTCSSTGPPGRGARWGCESPPTRRSISSRVASARCRPRAELPRGSRCRTDGVARGAGWALVQAIGLAGTTQRPIEPSRRFGRSTVARLLADDELRTADPSRSPRT